MCAPSLEACLVQSIFQLSPFIELFLPVIVHSSQGRLDPKWLQPINDFLGNGAIHARAPK